MKSYVVKNGRVYVYINNVFSHFIVNAKAVAQRYTVPEKYL